MEGQQKFFNLHTADERRVVDQRLLSRIGVLH